MSRRIKPGVERVYLNGRVIRVVAQKDASRLVTQGKAVEVYNGTTYMGVKLMTTGAVANHRTAVAQQERMDRRSVLEDADAMKSCVILSAAEVEAIAFRTKSRTEGLTEAQRDSRVLRGFPEMDLPERARAKFHQLFPTMATA